jgi:hypothetical protein
VAEEISAFVCQNIGISGTTGVFVIESEGKYIARVGVAIMGYTNMKPEELAKMSPFDREFTDNYAEGEGDTKEAALEALKADMKKMSNSLWD